MTCGSRQSGETLRLWIVGRENEREIGNYDQLRISHDLDDQFYHLRVSERSLSTVVVVSVRAYTRYKLARPPARPSVSILFCSRSLVRQPTNADSAPLDSTRLDECFKLRAGERKESESTLQIFH